MQYLKDTPPKHFFLDFFSYNNLLNLYTATSQ